LLGLHQRVHHVRLVPGEIQADAAQFPLGKPLGMAQLFPGFAAVVGHVESAARPPRLEEPRPAAMLPHRSDQVPGIARIHHQVAGSGAGVDIEHLPPGLAAVGGLVHPAVFGVGPGVAQGSHVHHVRVGGIEQDGVNGPGILEAHASPGLAPIQGAIHPGAHTRRVAAVALAGPDPNDVGVGLKDPDGPDRGRGERVGERHPGHAAVDRLPQAARRGTHVHDVGVARERINSPHPPAHARRADAPSLQSSKPSGIHLGPRRKHHRSEQPATGNESRTPRHGRTPRGNGWDGHGSDAGLERSVPGPALARPTPGTTPPSCIFMKGGSGGPAARRVTCARWSRDSEPCGLLCPE